jgi:hypothetical protein
MGDVHPGPKHGADPDTLGRKLLDALDPKLIAGLVARIGKEVEGLFSLTPENRF